MIGREMQGRLQEKEHKPRLGGWNMFTLFRSSERVWKKEG